MESSPHQDRRILHGQLKLLSFSQAELPFWKKDRAEKSGSIQESQTGILGWLRSVQEMSSIRAPPLSRGPFPSFNDINAHGLPSPEGRARNLFRFGSEWFRPGWKPAMMDA